MSATYDSLDEYNTDVRKAREAYQADEAARAGLCAVCQERRRDGRHRQCWRCRHEGRREGSA